MVFEFFGCKVALINNLINYFSFLPLPNTTIEKYTTGCERIFLIINISKV